MPLAGWFSELRLRSFSTPDHHNILQAESKSSLRSFCYQWSQVEQSPAIGGITISIPHFFFAGKRRKEKIRRKKRQKENFALCGAQEGLRSLHPAAFWKRRAKTFTAIAESLTQRPLEKEASHSALFFTLRLKNKKFYGIMMILEREPLSRVPIFLLQRSFYEANHRTV